MADTLQSIYDSLTSDREDYLKRGRESSEVTLPYILTEQGSNQSTKFANPYSSVGGQGVQNLASKLITTLFPTNTSFFDIVLDAEVKRQYEEQSGATKGEVERALKQITAQVNSHIDTSNYIPTLYTSFLHLLITGNILLWNKDDNLVQYPLDAYVVQRDKKGSILQIVCTEMVSPKTLTDEVITACQLDATAKEYTLYTGAILEEGKYKVYQEINDLIVPGSETAYKRDALPFLALQFTNSTTDQHYGRSLIDTVISDLNVLDGLTKAVLQVSAVSSKLLLMVNPTAEVDVNKLSNAKSGDFILMKPDDVQALQFDKNNDLSVAYNVMQTIEARLQKVFLMPSDALNNKQMTATEIRFVAVQLETALGGVYSNMQNQLQLPLLRIVVNELTRKGVIPEIPTTDGNVNIKIVAGFSGIGQSRDLENLNGLVTLISNLGDDAVATYVNIGEMITRFANALNIDTQDLVKTQDEIQQEQQAQQQAQERAMLMETMQQGAVANMDAEAKATNQPQPQQPVQ